MLVKICGMSEQPVIDLAASLGADMCGFIFHRPSPRYVGAAQAARLETHGMARVGVFVSQSVDEVAGIMREAALDRIQLHGGQSAEFAAHFPPEAVIRVLWPARYADRKALQASIDAHAPTCGMYLLDAGMGGGRTLDWPSLVGLRFPRPWLLAGGIGPENAAEALAVCAPDGLDLNSRLESSPGRKSPERMRQIFSLLRAGRTERGHP